MVPVRAGCAAWLALAAGLLACLRWGGVRGVAAAFPAEAPEESAALLALRGLPLGFELILTPPLTVLDNGITIC
jgi:hypothetical protein